MSAHQLRTKLHDYLEYHRPNSEHPNYVMESGEQAVIRVTTPKYIADRSGVFPQCTKFVEDALEHGAGINLYDRIMQDMEDRRPSDVSRWPIHGSEASNGYRYSSLVMHARDPYDSDNLAAYLRHTHQMIESAPHNAHTFQIGDILFFKIHGVPKMEHVAMVRGIDHNGNPEMAESTGKAMSYLSWQAFEHNVHTQGLQLVCVGRLHELSQTHEQSQLKTSAPVHAHEIASPRTPSTSSDLADRRELNAIVEPRAQRRSPWVDRVLAKTSKAIEEGAQRGRQMSQQHAEEYATAVHHLAPIGATQPDNTYGMKLQVAVGDHSYTAKPGTTFDGTISHVTPNTVALSTSKGTYTFDRNALKEYLPKGHDSNEAFKLGHSLSIHVRENYAQLGLDQRAHQARANMQMQQVASRDIGFSR